MGGAGTRAFGPLRSAARSVWTRSVIAGIEKLLLLQRRPSIAIHRASSSTTGAVPATGQSERRSHGLVLSESGVAKWLLSEPALLPAVGALRGSGEHAFVSPKGMSPHVQPRRGSVVPPPPHRRHETNGWRWRSVAVIRPSTRHSLTGGCAGASRLVPSAGFEPAHTAPEADALSPELRGRARRI